VKHCCSDCHCGQQVFTICCQYEMLVAQTGSTWVYPQLLALPHCCPTVLLTFSPEHRVSLSGCCWWPCPLALFSRPLGVTCAAKTADISLVGFTWQAMNYDTVWQVCSGFVGNPGAVMCSISGKSCCDNGISMKCSTVCSIMPWKCRSPSSCASRFKAEISIVWLVCEASCVHL